MNNLLYLEYSKHNLPGNRDIQNQSRWNPAGMDDRKIFTKLDECCEDLSFDFWV